jgi:hypothetical protein
MGLPVATTGGGICFAFPDVVNTPVGPATAPIPYPNIGQLSDATGTSTTVKVGGNPVILKGSTIPSTSGDEAGTAGLNKGKVTFTNASSKVKMNGDFVVRMTDPTSQNGGNATGVVLGGVPTVLCG